MFYKEDSLTVIGVAERALKVVDYYNLFKQELHLEKTRLFEEETQKMGLLMLKLKAYPYSKDISLDRYPSGSVVSSEEQWIYSRDNFSLKKMASSDQPEEIEFSAKGHHFQIANGTYGSVLWNTQSWVWVHPKCPFIIRYDWYENGGIFKQHISPIRNPKQVIGPLLSDWQLLQGGIRAVTVGDRTPLPEVPDITSWDIFNNIPPQVILLVVSFHTIRGIVHNILGIQNEYVATGLDPIF